MGFPTIAPLENGQEMNTLVSGISSKAKSSHPQPMGNAGVTKHKVHVTKLLLHHYFVSLLNHNDNYKVHIFSTYIVFGYKETEHQYTKSKD